jgi:hypothetical protein
LLYLQVDEPLVIGQPTSFFGAVISEQAVRTTEAMMAMLAKRRRIIGVSPDERKGGKGN